MANKKNKVNKNKVYKSEITANTSFRDSMLKIVKILVVVLIIFGIFYILTVYLTNRKDNSDNKRSVSEAIIQYEEILAGSSFKMKDSEYIVIYYDKSNEELKSNITNFITTYQDKKEHLSLYTVDMSSAFNSKFTSSEGNTNPSNVNDLKIVGPTLIKFVDNQVTDYIEGSSEIENYLN